MATTTGEKRLTIEEITAALKREQLIGVRAAAKLLGMAPSNFIRDVVPQLTRVPVEGSAAVYFRSEVAKQRRRRRRRAQSLAAARARSNGH